MYGYVYKFTFLPTEDWYVGKHKYLKCLELDPNYWGSGKKWKLLISQYDKKEWPNLIKREIIEWCETEEKLNEREIYWVEELCAQTTGLNINPGGEGNVLPGFKLYTDGVNTIHIYPGDIIPMGYVPGVSDEIKQIRSVNSMGENNNFYGKHHTEETRELLREINTGHKDSEGTKLKKSTAMFKRWEDQNYQAHMSKKMVEVGNRPDIKRNRSIAATGANNPMARMVLCVETGQVFSQVSDATIWLKETTGHCGAVGRCCKNGKATMGYHFRYCDDKHPNYAHGRNYNYTRPVEVSDRVSNSLHIYHSNKNK